MSLTARRLRQYASLAALRADPAESAKEAGLQYVTDTRPGIRRRRSGRGFTYRTPDGTLMRDQQELHRIKALGIPPAWTDVWICTVSEGHLQATGRDAKGRKQYRYHPHWRARRDQTKYAQMCAFGEALPVIRLQVEHDLSLPGLPQAKVLATVLRLLEITLIRVGNESYARVNHSFGLTTLRDRHVDFTGATLRFRFRGKSDKEHLIAVHDRRLARIVRHCHDLPGQELFQYIDDESQPRTVDSADVNAYLRQITAQDFTTKDFRTWAGSVLAVEALQACGTCESLTQRRLNLVQVIKAVASRLGNTPAICRKCYVNPVIINAYMEGSLLRTLQTILDHDQTHPLQGLSPQEWVTLRFLQQTSVPEINGGKSA
jgi:DNA topoisomerase-1